MQKLIFVSTNLNLPNKDIIIAKEYLNVNEFELCFSTLITQLYEYDIKIDYTIYELIAKIGELMKIDHLHYSFMKDLIK
ncbi:MafI family immunity protein [Flavobacterium sp. xlx-214]|uniref:MafI family immunity protein n=1 Tax=Flavobacterium sp. xlx-214 TaxID=2654325 RepID=UPI001C68F03C|nr:MafI family immunity protein [Flavobacterium sp. xlx-214]